MNCLHIFVFFAHVFMSKNAAMQDIKVSGLLDQQRTIFILRKQNGTRVHVTCICKSSPSVQIELESTEKDTILNWRFDWLEVVSSDSKMLIM